MTETLKDQLLKEQLAVWSRGPEPPQISPRTAELMASARRRPRSDSRVEAWAAHHGHSTPAPSPSWVGRCQRLMSSAMLTEDGLAAKAGLDPDHLRGLLAGGAFTQDDLARVARALRVPVSSLTEPDPVVPARNFRTGGR